MSDEISELLGTLKDMNIETLAGEFQAGDIYFPNKGADKSQAITDDLKELIESVMYNLFQDFYEDEGLDIDDCYGSFEILCDSKKINLTIHYETEEHISVNFHFLVQDFTVRDRKITFDISSILKNPSLLLTDDEPQVALPPNDEFRKIFQESPERITVFLIGMGGDGYAHIVCADENITIKPDERYDWDFSDEIESVFLALDFDLSELRSVREIEG